MLVSAASPFLRHYCWPGVIERYTHMPTFAHVHVTERVCTRVPSVLNKSSTSTRDRLVHSSRSSICGSSVLNIIR